MMFYLIWFIALTLIFWLIMGFGFAVSTGWAAAAIALSLVVLLIAFPRTIRNLLMGVHGSFGQFVGIVLANTMPGLIAALLLIIATNL